MARTTPPAATVWRKKSKSIHDSVPSPAVVSALQVHMGHFRLHETFSSKSSWTG